MIHTTERDATEQRLREVSTLRRNSEFGYLLRAVKSKQDKLTKHTKRVLEEFPVEGLDIGYYSGNLIYSPKLTRKPRLEHIALVRLVALGYLAVMRYSTKEGTTEVLQRRPRDSGETI